MSRVAAGDAHGGQRRRRRRLVTWTHGAGRGERRPYAGRRERVERGVSGNGGDEVAAAPSVATATVRARSWRRPFCFRWRRPRPVTAAVLGPRLARTVGGAADRRTVGGTRCAEKDGGGTGAHWRCATRAYARSCAAAGVGWTTAGSAARGRRSRAAASGSVCRCRPPQWLAIGRQRCGGWRTP